MTQLTDDQDRRVRLHIIPFNQELLPRFIPPPLEPLASNISFHTIETFPEKGFGFVELPMMEAEKLKKKFNGSTLKGTKVRISEAKPERKRKIIVHDDDGDASMHTDTKSTRKDKRVKVNVDGRNVVAGHELEEGRVVKRGWQGDQTKKSRNSNEKQSRTEQNLLEGKKMKFKTSLPPNAGPAKGQEKAGKSNKSKQIHTGKKDVVVKEFSKSTKLPPKPRKGESSSTKQAVSYEDGKGWMDEDGDVVEPENRSASKKRMRESGAVNSSAQITLQYGLVERDTHDLPSNKASDSCNSGDSVSSSEGEDSSILTDDNESETGSENSLSSSADTSEDESMSDAPVSNNSQEVSKILQAYPDDNPTPIRKEIHPLEALFKRPLPPTSVDRQNKPFKPTPIDTSFSFFNADDSDEVDQNDEDIEMSESNSMRPPQTPHTKADLEWRRIRSAAPTPDTARPDNKFRFSTDDDENDDDDDNEIEDEDSSNDLDSGSGDETDERHSPSQSHATTTSASRPVAPEKIVLANEHHATNEESEFRKWFYENRGELNREWKKRRREERKLKRQRENRRLSRKIA